MAKLPDPLIPILAPLLEESRVVDGGDDALRVSIALREALRDSGNCAIKRLRRGHAVVHVSTVEGQFLVKAFEAGFMARLIPSRFCASGRQWKALWGCVDLGLPCAQPVALLASRAGMGVNYLVVERAPNTATLSAYLERERERLLADPVLVRRLTGGLASFVAKLHRAGLLQHELRPVIIGVKPPRQKPEPFEFSLLEIGEQVASGSMAPEPARLDNLGEFLLGFGNWPATLKLRFLREYRHFAGDSGEDRPALRAIHQRATACRFEQNTLLVAACAEASSSQASVQRGSYLLLINRLAPSIDLEQLEEPLVAHAPELWEGLLLRHYELRLGEGNVCRLISEFATGDANVARRRLEGIWGKMLELDTLNVHAPAPLACLLAPGKLVALGRVAGRLEPLAKQEDRDWKLMDALARDLVKLHGAGCFFMPMEPVELLKGLSVALGTRGGRELVLSAPDNLFRGTPTLLGMQAVASLGRAARAISEGLGERAMKELIWTYARLLRLNRFDTQMLMEEAGRVPTGRTLVLTRGLEKSNFARGASR